MFKRNIWSTEADYIVSVDVLVLPFFRSTDDDVRWTCEWLLTANAGNWWTECTDPRDCTTRYRGHQWFPKNVFNSVVEVGSWTDVSLRLTFATEVGEKMCFRVAAVRMRNICCFLYIGFYMMETSAMSIVLQLPLAFDGFYISALHGCPARLTYSIGRWELLRKTCCFRLPW